MPSLAAPYAPRQPTETPLYRIVRASLETFLEWARETHTKPVPRYVEQDLRGYLRCGVFAHGFVRARCNACGHDLLVALSCKGRGICPSCAGRRMANTAAHLVDRVLPDVPLRQYVLSLPHELRRLAAFDPKVLTALSRIFAEAIFASHRKRAASAGIAGAASGAVTCVQRFGGSLNLNVHFHTIVIDGVFVRGPAGALGFVALPEPTREQLQALVASVARRATGWLRRQGHLSDEDPDAGAELTALDACVALAMQRTKLHKLEQVVEADDADDPEPPSLAHRAVEEGGFNLHAGVRVRDDLARERLCRYALRPAVALSRLRRLRDGRVAYRVKRASAGKAKHMVLTPLELLARIAALVPPPRYPLVRYHGVLAPRSSWRRLVIPRPREPRPCPVSPRAVTSPAGFRPDKPDKRDAPPRRAQPPASTPPTPGRSSSAPKTEHLVATPDLGVQHLAPNVLSVQHWHRLEEGLLYAATPRVDWPTLLRRTFDIDVLQCPRCEGRLRILSVITDEPVVARILPALGLPTDAPTVARARDPTDLLDFDQSGGTSLA